MTSGLKLLRHALDFQPVARLANHLDVRLTLEEPPHPLPKQLVVVREQDSDHR